MKEKRKKAADLLEKIKAGGSKHCQTLKPNRNFIHYCYIVRDKFSSGF